MPRYRIQTYGGAGGGLAGFSITGTTMLVEDRDSRQVAVYDLISGDYGKSPWPFSLTAMSSWSDFESGCGISNLGGKVLVYGANTGVYSKSGIKFVDGCMQGKFIDTSGAQLGTPGAGGSAGVLMYRGMAERQVRSWAECDYCVGIWYPAKGLQPWLRREMKNLESIVYLGYFDMSTVVGHDSSPTQPTYVWKWNPRSSGNLPSAIMSSRSGVWSLGSVDNMGSADASLVEGTSALFGMSVSYKEFARLSQFQRVLEEGQNIVPNTFDSAASYQGDHNGAVGGYDIIWLLTKERSI